MHELGLIHSYYTEVNGISNLVDLMVQAGWPGRGLELFGASSMFSHVQTVVISS